MDKEDFATITKRIIDLVLRTDEEEIKEIIEGKKKINIMGKEDNKEE